MSAFLRARERMVEQQLRGQGIVDGSVLDAMSQIPRERFVSEAFTLQAYQDSSLPIGDKQTISQPYIVALMTEALELKGRESVLEIGTGSGYQTAVLSLLVAKVYTIERHASLCRRARETLEALGRRNIVIRNGDGTLGWREFAPYDAVLVTACGPHPPQSLLDQVAVGGRLVMPVGTETSQYLYKYQRTPGGIEKTRLCGVRFVPLIGRFGWEKVSSGP